MGKGGITRKLEDTVKSLDQMQLKKALFLTDNEKTSRQHEFVKEAAQTCLANKDNPKTCDAAIKEARNKVQDTITPPMDDTSLEGLEEYLAEKPKPTEQTAQPEKTNQEKSDDELYENCEECHVAVAADRFADVCAENPEEAGSCELLSRSLENETTTPADWIKAMTQTAEEAKGQAKQDMIEAVTELTDYLEKRDSPILKQLDKEVNGA